ncbi:LamG-like jellyroll fold domain-containing protein [Kitasatospora sp. NPDC057223]|uniref:LamG-like jellyroll fold domain-containing protein n=1 Tax=Kitasatospora sp. NPDC057223 TaxID=3346055 RepID=UPI003644FFAA
MADIVFSGGGGQPLVRMSRAGRELKLSWPKPLPKPEINGSTAEYKAILPDVDLRMTATTTGFTQMIVVHTAAAAKNPELDQLRLGLEGSGLAVTEAPDGSLQAVDKGAGGVVFEAPKPMMWDSSSPLPTVTATSSADVAAPDSAKAGEAKARSAPATQDPAPSGGDSGAMPGEGAKVSEIAVDVPTSQNTIVLTPSQAMLDDPATVYPVMIDPAWYTPNAADWAGVSRYLPNQPYWHYSYNGSYVHDWGVGYCGDTTRCAPTDLKRSFFQIPTSQFIGKQILSAQFGTYESWSYSCNARPIELWNTSYINSGLTWNKQNAAGFWSRKLETMNTAKGWSSSCPGGWLEFGGNDAVKNLIQDGANWSWPSATFGLKAEDESDSYGWKRFTDDAFLRVYYNLRPNQSPQSDLTMSPGSVCQGTAVLVNKMPQITARASDPDGEAIGVQFVVGWDDGSGWKRRWWSTGAEGAAPDSSSFKGSGSIFSLSLPDSLPHNIYLTWEMRAWDGASWGPWSSDGDPTACYVTVDTSRPDGPAVTSTSYPGSKDASAVLPWTDGVGKYGDFTIDSVATDVVKYLWGLDTSASAAHEVATSAGGAQTIRLLLETPGVHILSVQALDASNNASQLETYYFNVLAGQPKRDGWALDETSGTTFAGTGEGIDAALSSGAMPQAPGHLGTAVSFDGTANGYANTQGSVLDTSKSFTVSVWANLANADVTRTAVAQAGANTSFFSLGERGGKWSFTTFSQDLVTGFSWQQATGTAAATANRWTHLTGVYDAVNKQVRLYVDGALAAQGAAPVSFAARGPLEAGRLRYMGNYVDPWKGSLDELKVWDRSLSAAEAADVAADRTLTAGLPAKAVWHLDENARTVTGLPESDALNTFGGVQPGVPGAAATAAHFDGTTGYARTARPQVDGTRSFAVSTWVKLPAIADGDTMPRMAVNQAGAHNNEFSLYYSPYWKRWIFGRYKEDTSADTLVRTMQPDCAPGSTVNGVPCFSGTDNHWTHLLGVSDATTHKNRLYINGFLVAESDYTQTTPWPNPGPLQLGAVSREGANGEYYSGDIDDVQIYDRVVTAPEAAALVKQRPQLVGRWKLDTATGTPLSSPDEGPSHSVAQLDTGASINAGGGLYMDPGTLTLDGATGYAQSTATPLHTNQSFTLAAWANTVGQPNRDMTVLSQAGSNGSAVTVRWHDTGLASDGMTRLGEWQAEVRDSDGTGTRTLVAHSSAGLGFDNWTHVAVVYDALANRLSLYVNGSLENRVCADGDTACTNRASWGQAVRPFEGPPGLQFGRTKASGFWGEYFSGELDDVWAYQGVLSPVQIAKLADFNTEQDTTIGL